jgi:hypothetical protein
MGRGDGRADLGCRREGTEKMTKAAKKAILRSVDRVLVAPLGRAPRKEKLEDALRWIWDIDFGPLLPEVPLARH